MDSTALLVVLVTAFIASLMSIRLGISVAILEIVLGIVLGNVLGMESADHEWLAFLAGIGSVVLTFLAGAEIDPDAMKKDLKGSLVIGTLSFLAPFLGALAFAYYVLGWATQASLITGIALSTTSVAVVYIVLVEAGTSKTRTGSLILSACFVTDLGTALALSLLFVQPNYNIIFLLIAIVIVSVYGPKVIDRAIRWIKGRGGEGEVKLLLVLIIGLGALAEVAGVHAVLPAYILGLVTARVMGNNKTALQKLRTVCLAMLTPIFFINAGMNVSVAAVVSGIGLIAVLFGVKVITKFIGVLPATKYFVGRDSVYITLLMSTGLTFGTISAQYGLNSGIIDEMQFSILVMVVVLTAVIPTVFAQKMFSPKFEGGNR
ncbi:MAG: cation:proton antiporter [Methanomassiliicoccales archaeon]|nr:MAG: cation:proton antiporter [Methanomassiliicoccales archaeon]